MICQQSICFVLFWFGLVSGVEFSDSSLVCSTQCSSQVSSLIPLTHLAFPPPTSPPATLSLFLTVGSLFYGLPPSLFFFFPLCSSVLFLNSTSYEIIWYLSFSNWLLSLSIICWPRECLNPYFKIYHSVSFSVLF